jgi:hypothetical protein
MSALPPRASHRRPKPPCPDDDADVDVDARNVLSSITILPLPHRVTWMQGLRVPAGAVSSRPPAGCEPIARALVAERMTE